MKTYGMYTSRGISLISSWNEKYLDKSCRENQNTFSPRKSRRIWDNVEKYCTARQATDDSMAHAHCMLDIQGHKHTLRICNTYCFSTPKIFKRTRLNVTLYVHFMSYG